MSKQLGFEAANQLKPAVVPNPGSVISVLRHQFVLTLFSITFTNLTAVTAPAKMYEYNLWQDTIGHAAA